VIVQIAQAVQHASRRGLIHRDIKPANIVVTTDGIAKLADLGLARATADEALARREQGVAIGTPFYIAPEAIEGRVDLDARADIYSLGATLYHMVTGQPPFNYPNVEAVFKAHQEEPLTPPDHLKPELSAGLGEVVEFMMAKDRDDRYRTPDDLILDLECLLAGDPPKIARQKIAVGTLAGLAEGEADEPARRRPRKGSEPPGGGWLWVAVLGGLLGLSALMNLIQLMRRG
jgi:serine/threonine-protein kinase